MRFWFRRKVDLHKLEQLRQSLLNDFLIDLPKAGQFDRVPVEALTYSAILEGLSLLSKYQPHPHISNYYLMAKLTLDNDDHCKLIDDFSETFRRDTARWGTTPNWIPRMLGEHIDRLVFHRTKPWEQGNPGPDFNIADALSLAMAIAYGEKVLAISKNFRL